MRSKGITTGALTGALYILLTLCFQPLSMGLVQLRVSEALCILPCFSPAAVPGLFVGCFLANLLMGASPYDVVFGSLATLLGALGTRYLHKKGAAAWLLPLPPVLLNAYIVGALLSEVYQAGVPFPLCALYVGLGEALACYGLGLPLRSLLQKYAAKLF